MEMSRTISVLVKNRPRVLARIAGLFARRGFNIDSLAVSTTESEEISRMTIATTADSATLAQIARQVNKLHDVVQVIDHTDHRVVERELCLIKAHVDRGQRAELISLCDVFRGDIVDIGNGSVMVQLVGDKDKIDAFAEIIGDYEIVEMVRSGKIVLDRGVQRA
ncbi:MAG: acetolactate synthase small subunit [Armatimonadota bacterium]|jgi:acetolactate synthase-1/3 small subunit